MDKKVGWVLEFEDEKLNEKAYQILHTKKFGQHKVKAYKVTSDLIIPGVSYVNFLRNQIDSIDTFNKEIILVVQSF